MKKVVYISVYLSIVLIVSMSRRSRSTGVSESTIIGLTYTPTQATPNPDKIASFLHTHKIRSVRLLNPSPPTIRSFSYTNTTLFISLPNSLIPPFSQNLSQPTIYLFSHIIPFYPRAKIAYISLGSDSLSDTTDVSKLIMPALENLRSALDTLSLNKIMVSTTLNFVTTVTTAFPPSSAQFVLPAGDVVFKPLLNFLAKTNSSLFVDLYPYRVYKLKQDVPIGFALFQPQPYAFIDDIVTGVRYRNLFDMMVDAIVGAMAVAGHENIPIVVTETGWPASGDDPEADVAYAGMYNRGLMLHLREGFGTPLRKEGVAAVYIYQMFDGGVGRTDSTEEQWGMFYPNMTKKYDFDFSQAAPPAQMALWFFLALQLICLFGRNMRM